MYVRAASPRLFYLVFVWLVPDITSRKNNGIQAPTILQYSTLYIPWRNAYLYRDMNHGSSTFPRAALLSLFFGIIITGNLRDARDCFKNCFK